MAEYKHADRQQIDKMMKRRRLFFAVVAAVVIVAVLATVVTVTVTKKKAAAAGETSTKAPVTTEAPTESTTADTQTATTEPETTTEDPTTTAAATTTTTAAQANTTTAAPASASFSPSASVDSEGKVTFKVDAAYTESHKYCIAVNKQANTVTVYGKDDKGKYTKPVIAFACSCGKPGHESPSGTYCCGTDRSDWKHEWLYPMADNSYGRYTTQIESGIWFHSVCYTAQSKNSLEYEEYNKLGTNASLGCIRLCIRDAKWIYDNVSERYTAVYFYESSVPGPLGKPETIKIDVNSKNRGWDPTDPDPENPWNK